MTATLATSPAAVTFDDKGEVGIFHALLMRLLLPLARLCLARGITFATAEELFKRAFVQEAKGLQPGMPEHGMVSRIATATGINRREVTRLTGLKELNRAGRQPVAAEIFARWISDPFLRGEEGTPLPLKRLGEAPSFEALAQSITRDVHHRSILDELIRLGLVVYDEKLDLVTLVRHDFVPQEDVRQMFGFLSDNVGDHLDAAVANVLCGGASHLEQAVFADELSARSVEALQPRIRGHWKALHDDLVPVITALIEADRKAGRPQDQRMRIGLYSFSEAMPDVQAPPETAPLRRYRKAAPKEQAQ